MKYVVVIENTNHLHFIIIEKIDKLSNPDPLLKNNNLYTDDPTRICQVVIQACQL